MNMLDNHGAICTDVGGGESSPDDFPATVTVLGVGAGGEDIGRAGAGVSCEGVEVALFESVIKTVD